MAHFQAERDVVAGQIRYRLEQMQPTFYRKSRPIEGWETVITGTQQGPAPIPTTGWEPWATKSQWGGYNITQWFRATVTVPDEMAGEPVVVILYPGGESLVYVNGAPFHGLDVNHSEVLLSPEGKGGEVYEIVMETHSTANMFDHSPDCIFGSQSLAIRDDLVWSFYWDIKVAYDTYKTLAAGSQESMRLLDTVAWGIKLVDLNTKDDVEVYHAQIRDAQSQFRAKLRAFETPATGKITWIGHSHIDTAWLWQLREAQRKCSRTFSTVLNYMDQYPEYIYSQGQPQLYAWVKENYPTIWEGIKKRVAEGRWEVTGAGWVEQDSNVSGAEALVRQYLYGRRFFKKEFGKDVKLVWLPDAFGFPVTMPQIWKKAGLKAFGTTKINWSQYNQFPYSMFSWRGLDGSEIFAYMPPGNYNADPAPASAVSSWGSFKQKDIGDEIPISFGHGDGGGGATREMLENLRRIQNMVGLPKSSMGTMEATVARMIENVDGDRMPVYHDELYLELHRGCQTTQGRTKRFNRKCELLLRDTEFLGGLAHLGGTEYPTEAIERNWKVVLTNQFHDILPGSSIREVYTDAEEDYAKVVEEVTAVREATITKMNAGINTAGEGSPVVVRNTLGWDRSDIASVDVVAGDNVSVLDPNGEVTPSQLVEKADGAAALLFEANVRSLGHSVYRAVEGERPVENTLKATDRMLENSFFRIELTTTGTIQSIFDKINGREVVPEGAEANELQLFEDRPHAHDAWDIDFNIDENRWPMDDVVSIEVTERGPVRATVRVVKKTDKSTLTQDISVWANNPRIDFATSVEWFEKYRLLKVAFPVDIMSRNATYEIQYGAIERPTHYSNERDRAKFEVAGHRWIDMSEDNYGVSVLNDCKYGFDTHDNTMRISLLRGAVRPDPKADEGHHDFTYSLYPHSGTWQQAGTVRKAYELNAPLVTRMVEAGSGKCPPVASFAGVDAENVVIDSVKKAEDSDAIIVRLYEAHGWRGPVKLAFMHAPSAISECNLMEEEDVECTIDDGAVSFDIKPWEIRTFKVSF
jgi:alpha-mannosidase